MSAKPANAVHHHHAHNAKGFVREVSAACTQRGLRLTEIRMQVLGLIAASEKPVKAYDLLDRLKDAYVAFDAMQATARVQNTNGKRAMDLVK